MSQFRLKIKKQELRSAESIGGTKTPCSGALFFAKGDASGEMYLAECKRTDRRNITIRADVLEKISKEASLQGKLPLLFIELQTKGVFVEKNWVLMELPHFKSLTQDGKK